MRTLLLIILFSISLKSQWVYDVGYSVSKETFENAEWRIYEGELQVHHNDTSYFYNIENLKLNDKLKVVDDVFVYPKNDEYQSDLASFEVIENKFDKVTIKILGTNAYIFDEKSQDTLEIINLLKYMSIVNTGYSDLYLSDTYKILTSNKNVIIYNRPVFAVWEISGRHAYGFSGKPFLINYNIELDSIIPSNHLSGYNNNHNSFYDIYYKNSISPYFIFYDYSTTNNYGLNAFFPLSDSLIKISNKSIAPSNNSFINKSFEYLTSYNNYTFNSRELKNWNNQVIDTNIRKYKARLIQEIIPNTYLMYSDSINYFIYNIIDNNLVVMDKLNDIHKKEQFINEYVDEEKNLFYAETASHKIARVSISSIIDNLISVDFAADKNMADSNYVFTFENKSVGEIDEYLWSFGDGNTSTEKSPKHKYDSSGTYDITLTCSGAGQSTSNTKKGHIYIPTPVRLHVSHTMTLNEKDASFYVSSGATGSRLKYRLRTSPFNDLDEITTNPLIDTLQASSYSFTTNKSYFSRYFIFEVWNEMYSAYKYYNITDIEFDIWNKDLVNEKVIDNKNYSDENLIDKVILIENETNDPIIISELKKNYIEIKNLSGINEPLNLNNKKLSYNTDEFFITNDNFYYSFSILNGINKIDSINLNNYLSDSEVKFYDYYDENSFLMMSKDSIYIFNNKGDLLEVLKRPNQNKPAFFRKFGNEYYFAEREGTTADKLFKIFRYNENLEVLYQYNVMSGKTSPTQMKSFVQFKNDTLYVDRVSNTDIHKFILDVNTKKYTYEYNIESERNYSNVTYNKYLSFKYTIYRDIYSGNYEHIYSIFNITDLNNLNQIYNYAFNERVGEIKAANLINGYVYLYGNFRSNYIFKNTLLKLDLKDEMYLDVEEAKLGENKYIWERLLKINTTLNFNTDYKIFNLLGEEIKKDNYRLSINKDNIEIEAISISKGIYKLQLGEQNFILLK